eukprot:TRINITY_DN4011_c0_g1_i1.p1 TRINITY_DN4011_c0_g1~~TRINITY_DN4011_c0_g1_i1.p1  ORF type:complete len:324 (+),score=30.41 TRINITY_DN4011_c0_g1_i1:96-974(+)
MASGCLRQQRTRTKITLGGVLPTFLTRSSSSSSSRPPPGLAAIPNVRPRTGEEAAAWIKSSLENYYTRSEFEGAYRSGAAWSLRQLDDRFSFFKPDTVVVDLGCFPGGWSQVAGERTYASSSSSAVIGVDTVRMDPLDYHTFIQGDVGDDETLERILEALGDRRADLVLSDLSPPLTGLKPDDHLNSMQCCLNAAKIMERTLRLGGWFIAKMLVGPSQVHWRTYLDSRFQTVRSIKPPASRTSQGEMFCICKGFNGRQPIAGEVKGRNVGKHEGVDRWDGELQRQRSGHMVV